MSFLSSRKRPPSIVLPRGYLRELIRISEVVAYESFDCMY